jgi:hypothetical protein
MSSFESRNSPLLMQLIPLGILFNATEIMIGARFIHGSVPTVAKPPSCDTPQLHHVFKVNATHKPKRLRYWQA